MQRHSNATIPGRCPPGKTHVQHRGLRMFPGFFVVGWVGPSVRCYICRAVCVCVCIALSPNNVSGMSVWAPHWENSTSPMQIQPDWLKKSCMLVVAKAEMRPIRGSHWRAGGEVKRYSVHPCFDILPSSHLSPTPRNLCLSLTSISLSDTGGGIRLCFPWQLKLCSPSMQWRTLLQSCHCNRK